MSDAPQGPSVIRAVAFDLDDTLAVTVRDRETLLRTAASRADVPLTFDREDYLDAHRARSGTESRKPVFETLVDDDADALTRAYREVVGDALEPVDGADSMLASLGSDFRLGLLTDGPDETQRDKLRRLGWADAFDAVVVTGAIDAPKPAPEAFDALATSLGVEPAEVAFVGNDPERDVAGSAAAGMCSIQVVYEDGPAVHPDADATVPRDDLGELRRVLPEVVGHASNDA